MTIYGIAIGILIGIFGAMVSYSILRLRFKLPISLVMFLIFGLPFYGPLILRPRDGSCPGGECGGDMIAAAYGVVLFLPLFAFAAGMLLQSLIDLTCFRGEKRKRNWTRFAATMSPLVPIALLLHLDHRAYAKQPPEACASGLYRTALEDVTITYPLVREVKFGLKSYEIQNVGLLLGYLADVRHFCDLVAADKPPAHAEAVTFYDGVDRLFGYGRESATWGREDGLNPRRICGSPLSASAQRLFCRVSGRRGASLRGAAVRFQGVSLPSRLSTDLGVTTGNPYDLIAKAKPVGKPEILDGFIVQGIVDPKGREWRVFRPRNSKVATQVTVCSVRQKYIYGPNQCYGRVPVSPRIVAFYELHFGEGFDNASIVPVLPEVDAFIAGVTDPGSADPKPRRTS